MTKEQILAEVSLLDPVDQEEIADSILYRLDPVEQLTPEQSALIRKRIDDIEQGRVTCRPADAIVEDLQQKWSAPARTSM